MKMVTAWLCGLLTLRIKGLTGRLEMYKPSDKVPLWSMWPGLNSYVSGCYNIDVFKKALSHAMGTHSIDWQGEILALSARERK
jgi:hypothetical protein